MPGASGGAPEAPATILVVDDVPENLELLGELLMPQYRVRAAPSGPRALQAAVSGPAPDLILLDVMMPGMDGHDVLRHLRADPRTADVPVIFVTALDDDADIERGLALGAVDYIGKPLRPAVVLARVRTQLALKRARDRLRDHNRRLEAEVAERLAENLAIQNVTIHALGRLAEIRDPETGNHLRRTQAYVEVLARTLARDPAYADRLTPRAIELLVRSAPLHDLGKVAIPDSILLKHGQLSAAEWRVMQTHTWRGSDAIEAAQEDGSPIADFLGVAKEIAHWHHEHWDGSGYPDGLAGEAIPLSARLMAVADVFDALISSRSYKPAHTIGEARAMILEGRGTHFDPAVVAAFETCFAEFVAIAGRQRISEGDGPGAGL